MCPPHIDIGTLAEADRWLGSTGAVLEVVAAAVIPATAIDRAKMRTASFMAGGLFLNLN
jgi:hypothetical protein